jgi:hypothetical protein
MILVQEVRGSTCFASRPMDSALVSTFRWAVNDAFIFQLITTSAREESLNAHTVESERIASTLEEVLSV